MPLDNSSTHASTSSTNHDDTQQSGTTSHLGIAVDHPRLAKTDPASVRVFLRKYDQYCHTVVSRAKQLTTSATITEAVLPMELKYCVDTQHFVSLIELGFVPDVTSFDTMSNQTLRAYLDTISAESKNAVTMDSLDDLVRNELVMDMSNGNAKSRMQTLFADYHSLLAKQGVKWVISDNQKLAVAHVLAAIRPASLRERLESDLAFSHHALKKDFKKFLKHAVELSDAFQSVDNGPRRRPKKERLPKRSGNPTPTDDNDSQPGRKPEKKLLPLCLYQPCRAKGIRHLLRDCKECPPEEKKRLRDELAAKRAAEGPAHSTRSKTKAADAQTAGRVTHSDSAKARNITLKDDNASMHCSGRCDDGSDESIVSTTLAEAAVLKGIGRLRSVKPVKVRVAIKSGDEAQQFTANRRWEVPRLLLKLAAGPLALLNVSFIVLDAQLAAEDLLIGLPVLKHLGIDSTTMLERNFERLHETDCSQVDLTNASTSKIGRILIARIQRMRTHDASDAADNQSMTTSAQAPKQTTTNQPPHDRPRANYYDSRSAPDPFPNPNLLDLPDADQNESVRSAINEMFTDALIAGFPKTRFDELKQIVMKRVNVFRTTFSRGNGANIAPLKLELKPNAKPVIVKLRRYSESQKRFLRKLVDRLLDANLIYSNSSSKWACAPHLVPKNGPDEWRFTVDLRPVNSQTFAQAFPMPVLEMELTKASGCSHFAEFDMTHGYWQLLLHPSSQESQSFITPDGIYTPRRVLHGNLNANSHLHSGFMLHMTPELKQCILIWVDDMVIPAATIDDLLARTEMLLDLCSLLNFKLHPDKCRLYKREVTWCGRIISADGVRHNPRQIEGLESMDCPTTAAELLMFTSALQWMRSAIPDFSNLVAPLLAALERAYSKANSRTKRAAKRILLADVGWGQAEISAFANCKLALANRVKLAHRDSEKKLCFYADASDTHWAGITTQVPMADLHKPHSLKRHEPLSFLSGHFTDTQMRWSTFEKEAFGIMSTLDKMHWLASSADSFELYTDHNNLIFLFDPTAYVPDLTQAAIRKVIRWAVTISGYNYECVHISGEDNVWADLMTRWKRTSTLRRIVSVPALPSAASDSFIWPTATAIAECQAQHTPPHTHKLVDELWHTPTDRIWIPDDADEMQLRLCIVAHTSASGHRGTQSTIDAISRHYYWTTLEADVKLFVSSCIHCLSTTSGDKIPRPFGPSVHGTRPNDLIQFDYIELGKSTTGDKYVFMIRDDHSGYAWFYPTVNQEAEQAAVALIDWSAAFGSPLMLMSDGPSHFRNETMRLLAKGMQCRHHFTLPYCPWSNGGIERLGKELLRTARAIISELQLRVDSWPDVIPVIQSALNLSPSPQRHNVCPLTAFTGQEPRPPISTIVRSDTAKPITMSDLQRERAIHIDELVKLMADMRPTIQTSLSENRRRLREHMSRGHMPNFQEGDYVLVARSEFFKGEKLCLRWRGPRRIVKALTDFTFQVEDLRNGKVDVVHGSRLKYYHDASLNQTAIMTHVVNSETGMQVSRLMRLIKREGQIMVQVRWKGLSPYDDTFEPVQNVLEDVPQMLSNLLKRSATPQDLANEVRAMLHL